MIWGKGNNLKNSLRSVQFSTTSMLCRCSNASRLQHGMLGESFYLLFYWFYSFLLIFFFGWGRFSWYDVLHARVESYEIYLRCCWAWPKIRPCACTRSSFRTRAHTPRSWCFAVRTSHAKAVVIFFNLMYLKRIAYICPCMNLKWNVHKYCNPILYY